MSSMTIHIVINDDGNIIEGAFSTAEKAETAITLYQGERARFNIKPGKFRISKRDLDMLRNNEHNVQ